MSNKVFAGHSFRNDLIEAKVFAAVKRFMFYDKLAYSEICSTVWACTLEVK